MRELVEAAAGAVPDVCVPHPTSLALGSRTASTPHLSAFADGGAWREAGASPPLRAEKGYRWKVWQGKLMTERLLRHQPVSAGRLRKPRGA